MTEDRFAGGGDRLADREREHAKRNEEQDELVRHAVEQLRERRKRQRRALEGNGGSEPWDPVENDRRLMDRRAAVPRVQRRFDRGRSRWRTGLAFAMLGAVVGCLWFLLPRRRE